jgi:hypothetical protein
MEKTQKTVEEQRAEIIAESKAKHPEYPESYHRLLAEKYVPDSGEVAGG